MKRKLVGMDQWSVPLVEPGTAVPAPPPSPHPHVVMKGGSRPRMRCLHCRKHQRLPVCIDGDLDDATRYLRRLFSDFLMRHRGCPKPRLQ